MLQGGYRPELQGLRALAALLVVVYHVWIARVSGGVDVFFVITGFLLTGQLVRAAERGVLSIRARCVRSLSRLAPASSLVLVCVVAIGVAALPEGRWSQSIREVAAAAVYAENWKLAADSVDYAARSNTTSMVQHFWSLAIQAQVVLALPPLVAVVALSCGTRRELLRLRTTLVLAAVFVGSLTYSVELTAKDQPLAYFDTLARLWEFALGGLLALHIDRVRLSDRQRAALGWVGVLGLVGCGALVSVATAFPGAVALWPTGCAAIVLVAGHTRLPWAVDRLLVSRPAQWLGSISYPLYLWHWPLLIAFLAVTGSREAGPLSGAAIVVLSVALAHATHVLLEKPLAARCTTVRRQTRVVALGTVTALLSAGSWQAAVVLVRADARGVVGDVEHPGALALVGGGPQAGAVGSVIGSVLRTVRTEDPQPDLLPPLTSVMDDWNRIEYWNCTAMREFPMDACEQPRPDVDAQTDEPGSVTAPTTVVRPPAKRIVVVGDSHAQQLSAALEPIARDDDWQLIEIIRGACPFSTVSEADPHDHDCSAWLTAAYDTIIDLHPDAVVTLASYNVRVGLTERVPAGFVQQWRRLGEAGIPVVAIRDNPRFDSSVPDCVHRNGPDPDACGAARSELYTREPPWARVPDLPVNVAFVDIADAICSTDRSPAPPDPAPPVNRPSRPSAPASCSPARGPADVGNVLVYLDDNHVTASYATTMAPLIQGQVHAALGW